MYVSCSDMQSFPYFCKKECKEVSKITGHIYNFFSRFKFHIVIILGVLIVGVLDENSFMKRIEYAYQIEDLKTVLSPTDLLSFSTIKSLIFSPLGNHGWLDGHFPILHQQ